MKTEDDTRGFWLVPSRKRPENVKRLIASYVETEATTCVRLMLSREDRKFSEYEAINLPETWEVVLRNKDFTAPDAMRIAFKRWPSADFYGFLGDDVVLKTKRWDVLLHKEVAKGYIAWADDTIQGAELCTHPCIPGFLVRGAGGWALIDVKHSFVDTAWWIIGKNLGLLKYCGDVVFDHRHWLNDKAKKDFLYTFAANHFKQDATLFQKWQEAELPYLLRQLRGLRRA